MADTAKGYKIFFHIPSELAAPLHMLNLQICQDGDSRRDLTCVKSIRMRSKMRAGGAPILLLGAKVVRRNDCG